MAQHLTHKDRQELRAFIIAARRDDPRVSEREMYERYLATHPHLATLLTFSRFRYHVRALRREALRDLDVERAAGRAESPAVRAIHVVRAPPAGALTLGQRVDAAKWRRDKAELRRDRVLHELRVAQEELTEARRNVSELARELAGGERVEAYAPPEVDPLTELSRLQQRLSAGIRQYLPDSEARVPRRPIERLLDDYDRQVQGVVAALLSDDRDAPANRESGPLQGQSGVTGDARSEPL